MKLTGGSPIGNLTRDEFYKLYDIDIIPIFNLRNMFNEITLTKPFNVLIGAKNTHESDYRRFANSSFSLYIDKLNSNLQGRDQYEVFKVKEKRLYDRQYEMFTIFSNNSQGLDWTYNILSNFSKYKNVKKLGRFVDNYITDMYTAYFLPRDWYMNIIISTLNPGGKFIFEHTEHLSNTFIRLQSRPVTASKA